MSYRAVSPGGRRGRELDVGREGGGDAMLLLHAVWNIDIKYEDYSTQYVALAEDPRRPKAAYQKRSLLGAEGLSRFRACDLRVGKILSCFKRRSVDSSRHVFFVLS